MMKKDTNQPLTVAELTKRIEALEHRLNNFCPTPNQFPASAFSGYPANALIPCHVNGMPIPQFGGRVSDSFGPQSQWTDEQKKIVAAEQAAILSQN